MRVQVSYSNCIIRHLQYWTIRKSSKGLIDGQGLPVQSRQLGTKTTYYLWFQKPMIRLAECRSYCGLRAQHPTPPKHTSQRCRRDSSCISASIRETSAPLICVGDHLHQRLFPKPGGKWKSLRRIRQFIALFGSYDR